jgi:hypothetical protein
MEPMTQTDPPPPPAAPIYVPGRDPEEDAWFTAFFLENHLDHLAYPDHVATPEQVRFMVYTEENERYYPCSDQMFKAILDRDPSLMIQQKYLAVYQSTLALIEDLIEEAPEKTFLEALIRIKYQHEIRDEIMIPSRLQKRLLNIFINRTQIEDPYLFEKARRNQLAAKVLAGNGFQQALNRLDPREMTPPPPTLGQVRKLAETIALRRLIALSAESALWQQERETQPSAGDFERIFRRRITGNGADRFFNFLGIGLHERREAIRSRKILWLADEAGEILVDLLIIGNLTKLGHKVIIAFKEGPLFTKVDIHDVRADPILQKALQDAYHIEGAGLGKNQLAQVLRSDHPIFVLSDGTRENLNFLLTSTTFARVFKEVDGVVSRGADQQRRLFDTHFQFTQDIFNIRTDDSGAVAIAFKPRHPAVIKFSHADLEEKARAIIHQMAAAKATGMTVIFYSGIIGSIPGKLQVAKRIMSVFIAHLKEQLADTFIINPSEYFESGMDADDLMYMWEIVQRSGHIDIWRFQSYEDIARAFDLLGQKVPPEWVGKDATYSTGCTKEMNIALEVQLKYPEMQIIGPPREKFMRRRDYGVGKMYDQRLATAKPLAPMG